MDSIYTLIILNMRHLIEFTKLFNWSYPNRIYRYWLVLYWLENQALSSNITNRPTDSNPSRWLKTSRNKSSKHLHLLLLNPNTGSISARWQDNSKAISSGGRGRHYLGYVLCSIKGDSYFMTVARQWTMWYELPPLSALRGRFIISVLFYWQIAMGVIPVSLTMQERLPLNSFRLA